MRRHLFGAAVILLLACASAFAQQTTGTITGRVIDEQGAAIPGATVTAKSASTGFTRTEVSDAEGIYRLSALPVGIYDVTAELQGFATVSKKAIEVNVAQTQAVDFPMKVAQLAETVNVTGASPLIRDHGVVGRRRRRRQADREPAAQRPPVRQPRGDGARRRPRLPQRPDQEHAVRAARQRRRRPQHQLPDRRRRQQRRHRRRPASAVPARSDRAVQLPDAALQGRVRPQQRRRPQRRHQERHEHLVGQRASSSSATSR